MARIIVSKQDADVRYVYGTEQGAPGDTLTFTVYAATTVTAVTLTVSYGSTHVACRVVVARVATVDFCAGRASGENSVKNADQAVRDEGNRLTLTSVAIASVANFADTRDGQGTITYLLDAARVCCASTIV